MRFLAIPRPPDKTAQPVEAEVDSVVEVILKLPPFIILRAPEDICNSPLKTVVPVTFNPPPTYTFLAIPTPPQHERAPDVVLEASVVL